MDCTTGNNHSANLEHQEGATNGIYAEQMTKATTSGSSLKEQGQEDRQRVQQPSMVTVLVNKGKRTKRQRLRSVSPIPSSTYNNQEDHLVFEDDQEQLDLANCLILLARGQSGPSSSHPPLPSIPRIKSDIFTKLGGKKRRSYSSSSLNLAGIYECRTCNRTFSSFQALGGHRAGHKKLNSISRHDLVFSPVINPSSPSPLSLQLGNIEYSSVTLAPTPTTSAVAVQSNNNNRPSNKIHECCICGAEFSSGQALGGHMRRHRGNAIPLNSSSTTTSAFTNTIANTTLSLSTAIIDVESPPPAAGKVDQSNNNNNNGFLSLDLNLPASPSQEDTLPPKQPSAAMLFSTPALVDCFN